MHHRSGKCEQHSHFHFAFEQCDTHSECLFDGTLLRNIVSCLLCVLQTTLLFRLLHRTFSRSAVCQLSHYGSHLCNCSGHSHRTCTLFTFSAVLAASDDHRLRSLGETLQRLFRQQESHPQSPAPVWVPRLQHSVCLLPLLPREGLGDCERCLRGDSLFGCSFAFALRLRFDALFALLHSLSFPRSRGRLQYSRNGKATKEYESAPRTEHFSGEHQNEETR